MAILNGGKNALSGDVSELRSRRSRSDLLITLSDHSSLQSTADLLGGTVNESGVIIISSASQETVFKTLSAISEHKIPVLKVEHAEPDLEQLFMEVIGK